MDKSTLSNYGWIVIAVLVLSVMIALATPFGQYIENAVKFTTEGLFTTSQNAFNNMGLNAVLPDQSFDNTYEKPGDSNTETGNTGNGYDHNAPELHLNGTIPEGGKYTKSDGTILNAGEEFPNILAAGDKYEYGHYSYSYYDGTNSLSWFGWGVSLNTKVTDRLQEIYDPILESIANKPVTILTYTFEKCENMTIAPEIPQHATYIYATFARCKSLKIAPTLPETAQNISYLFSNCTSLEIAPIIPSNVTEMHSTFVTCTSLKTYYGSKDGDGDFSSYIIPDGVTEMTSSFSECKSLTKAPTIPATVEKMKWTFYNCEKLTGSIIINSTPSQYTACLSGTNITEIFGDCPDNIKEQMLEK